MDRFESLMVVCMSTPLASGPDAPYQHGNMGINLNAIGGSGVGKSARIREIGKALGLNVYSIFTATKTPEHIGGFPVMTPRGFTLECAMPQIRAAINDERAIIFLDEISSAPRAVQAAILSFLNERTVGEYTLPPGIRLVLAMNPPDIAANGRDLEVPLANRVLHFQYETPALNQWKEYMMGTYDPGISKIHDSDELVRLNWRAHYVNVLGTTEGYLVAAGGKYKEKNEAGEEVERSKLYDQPEADSPRASKAWPSHRTWSWAVNGVTTARCLGMGITVQTDIVEGLVGKGLAAEWTAYAKKVNLPHPLDVLSGKWQIPKQLDVVRTVLSSCAVYVAQEKNAELKAQLGTACWALLHTAATAGYADLSVRPAGTLLHAGLDLASPVEAVRDAASKMLELLNDKDHTKYIPR